MDAATRPTRRVGLTENQSDDDEDEELDDDASATTLPTSVCGSPITCSLEPGFFCNLYDVLYDGEVRKLLEVHRLKVSLLSGPEIFPSAELKF